MTDGHEGVPIRKLPTGVPGLDDVLGGGLPELSFNPVLESIVRQVEAVSPGWVVVDSFRSVLRVNGREGAPEVQDFVQRLALHLTAWEATTFLLGEFPGTEAENHPVFTVADGLVVLS